MKEVGELEKTDKVMSVGRVQTPIVSLIVRNHEEIENFVSVPFWTIEALNEDGLKCLLMMLNTRAYRKQQKP